MSSPKLESLVSQLDKLSPNEQRELQQALAARLDNGECSRNRMTENEFERYLVDRGALAEVPPPIADPAAYEQRTRVKVDGNPLSETITSDRRVAC